MEGVTSMSLPKFAKIRQKFQVESLNDITGTISEQFNHVKADEKIGPDMEIAITVGSRGIANIPLIVKSVADEIKKEVQHHSSFLQWEVMVEQLPQGKLKYWTVLA